MKRLAGLTLVELLLALAISSILALGVFELLAASQTAARLVRGQATLGEAGRLAMMVVARDLRQAGYRGCDRLTAADAGVLGLPYEFDLLRGLQGFEGLDGGWAPDFASAGLPVTNGSRDERVYAGGRRRAGVDLARLRAGSDFFTVWFLGAAAFAVVDPRRTLANGDEDLLLAAEEDEVEDAIRQDHIAFLGDCINERLFMVTRLASQGSQARLAHGALRRVGGTGNASANIGNGYGPGAEVRPLVSRTYYVGRGLGTSNLGEPVFSLYMKEGVQRPVELIEGVEDMQLLYGVDTGGADGAPDIWLDASRVADFRQVAAVRVQILASSVDSLGRLGEDGLLRRTLVQTLALRNRL